MEPSSPPVVEVHESSQLTLITPELITATPDGSTNNKPLSSSMSRGGSSVREGLFGLGCGLMYGMSSALLGHPIDTIKTKMQSQLAYAKGGMIHTMTSIVRNEGFFALYKGLLPPLLGSSIFRSVQFGVYSAVYTKMGDFDYFRREIPMTGGLETRVIFSGIVASTARSFIECPLEYIKVRKQVGESWQFSSLFQGFKVTWMRTMGLMITFFVLTDSLDRHATELVSQPVVGPFVRGAVCSTAGWTVVWPFETVKSQIQAGTPGPNTVWKRLVFVANTGGVGGLFRGFVPGCTRSLVANGASMVMFHQCQDLRMKYLEGQREPKQYVPAPSPVVMAVQGDLTPNNDES